MNDYLIGPEMTTIDWPYVRTTLARRALRGLNRTIRFAEERAKHYAPVRKIFSTTKGGGGRRGQRMSRGDELARGEHWSAHTWRSFRRARPQPRQVMLRKGGPEYGHPNSALPVFVRKSGERQIGDFRRYDSDKRALTTRGHGARSTLGKTSRTAIDPNEMLSGDGRREVQSGRAVYTKVAVTKVRAGRVDRYAGGSAEKPKGLIDPETGRATGFSSQIGGRLREEIYSLRPTNVNQGMVDGFVVSPTYYSVFQEYGTSHHRAHPFLRPALYEARSKLLQNIRTELKAGGGYQNEAGFKARTS